MEVAFLGSSSSGNSTLICSDDTNILIDAGITARESKRRLEILGRSPEEIEAILLSHEHIDHCRGAGILARDYGIPIFANQPTFVMAPVGNAECRPFKTGESFSIGDFEITAYPVPHNAAEPVCFSLSDGEYDIGFATDLGKITSLVSDALFNKDLLIIEANHDENMLWRGRYPEFLKRVISSPHGHLSNRAAAGAVVKLVTDKTQGVILAHLSEENNTPEKAIHEVNSALARKFRSANVMSAQRTDITPYIELD